MTSTEDMAKKFAERHHAAIGQLRKYTDELYITHPAAVVELARSVPHTPEMLAAAWLHDTVEDTAATLEEIFQEFGPQVAALVEMLTDVSRPTDGNRKIRKEIDRRHTAQASPEAKTIKLADLIDNSRNIIELDPGFAKVYLVEKAALLEVLKDGDPILWNMALNILKKANVDPNLALSLPEDQILDEMEDLSELLLQESRKTMARIDALTNRMDNTHELLEKSRKERNQS